MKYFIKMNECEKEVSKEKFIETEQFCGFYSKIDGEPATWDFGLIKNGIEISGRQQRDE